MKQGKIVLLPIIMIAIIIIAGLTIGLIGCNSKTTKSESVFENMSVKRLSDMGVKVSLDGIYRLSDVHELGYMGSAEIAFNKDNVGYVRFTAELSDSEKDAISAVTGFVKAYSNALGFPIDDNPTLVSFSDDESYVADSDNAYASLVEGYVLFEYSYRDRDGVLWLAHIYSPKDGSLCGSVTKQVNEEQYTDFVPRVDLSKEGEEK